MDHQSEHAARRNPIVRLGSDVLAVGAGSGYIHVWGLDGTFLGRLRGPHTVLSLAVLPHGHLVAGDTSGGITVWDVSTQATLCSLAGNGDVYGLAVLADGSLVAGREHGDIDLYARDTLRWVRTMRDGYSDVFAVTALADGTVAAATRYGSVDIWDPLIGRQLASLGGGDGGGAAYAVVELTDGRLAVARNWGAIEIRDRGAADIVGTLAAGSAAVVAVGAVGPDVIVGCRGAGDLEVWERATGSLRRRADRDASFTSGVVPLDDGYVATAGYGGVVCRTPVGPAVDSRSPGLT